MAQVHQSILGQTCATFPLSKHQPRSKEFAPEWSAILPGMSEVRLLGILGLFGCVLFTGIVAALTAVQWSFLQSRGWDPIRATDVPYPSTLALGPGGWLQVLNFAILGLALLGVAAGLWRALEPQPTAAVVSLVVAGFAGLALMAVTDGSLSSVRTWHGAVHVGAFFTLLIAVVLAALVIGLWAPNAATFGWLRLPRWRLRSLSSR
jgi:hypothetical protein